MRAHHPRLAPHRRLVVEVYFAWDTLCDQTSMPSADIGGGSDKESGSDKGSGQTKGQNYFSVRKIVLTRMASLVWCMPAFANRRMYVRNDSECICVDLAK
jgi:hypothetical protein